jgi:cytochrome c oxidase subunit 2
MKGLPYLKLVGAILVSTLVISVIMLIPNWDGEQASTAAPQVDNLLSIMIVLSSFVFSIVIVMLGYSLIKWRVKPGDEGDGSPIHGNTRLEIAWTMIPTVIVLVAAGLSWHTLDKIEAKDANIYQVNVTSQQYEWTFEYPTKDNIVTHELHVPVGQQVQFNLHALDVIHSFWVPEWRIKKDNVPGMTTTAIVTPNKIGEYSLICTELCGYGHATMRAKVVVQSRADFDAWAAQQEATAAQTTAPPAAGGAS